MMQLDKKKNAIILVILDLLAAFDTIYHDTVYNTSVVSKALY